MTNTDKSPDLAKLYRAESGRILAALVMVCRDISLAEDALQDAFTQALEKWPQSGNPDNKSAWLYTVAKRRLIDLIRKESHRSARQSQQAVVDLFQRDDSICETDADIPDERLRLIFSCCHPALAQNVQVALTLKTLCGLSSKEIARAYLSSEVTMNQRITRAKRKIRDAGISYSVPEGDALTERLPSVLATIYLIYNESYNAYAGQTLTRDDLADEAIRLARVLYYLLPNPSVAGLLGLMLLHDARRHARRSNQSSYIPLEQQDRSLWDQDKIREGTQLILTALAQGKPDSYQIEAAISSLHATSSNWQETDWPQIEQLYLVLYQLNPSPIVMLNLNVARAYKGELEQAYQAVKNIETDLADYQPYYAAKAELSSKLELFDESLQSYDKAIALTENEAEKEFLKAKREKVKFKLNK